MFSLYKNKFMQGFIERLRLNGATSVKLRKNGRLRKISRLAFAVVMAIFIILGFFEGCSVADTDQPNPATSMGVFYDDEVKQNDSSQ